MAKTYEEWYADQLARETPTEEETTPEPAWYATGEHPRHPEVAGQPDPAG